MTTTVLEEEPYAAIVSSTYLSYTCSACFGWKAIDGSSYSCRRLRNVELKRCLGCHELYYCSRECQKADWKAHKTECKLINECWEVPSDEVRMIIRILTRNKLKPNLKAFNGRTYESLRDTFDQDMADERSAAAMKKLYDEVAAFMGKQTPDFETVGRAISKMNLNSFPIHDGMYICAWRGIGIYLGLSGHKHTCRADCFAISDGAKLLVRTKDTSGVSEYSPDLPISFYSIGLLRVAEKKKGTKYECHCNYCLDEEKIGKDRSGLANCCSKGWFSVDNPVCSHCGNVISKKRLKMVLEANEEIESIVDYLDRQSYLRNRQDIDRCLSSIHMNEWLDAYKRHKKILTEFNVNLAGMCEMLYRAALISTGPFMAMEFVDGCLQMIRSLPPSVMVASYFCQRYMIYALTDSNPTLVSAAAIEAQEMLYTVFGEHHETPASFDLTVELHKIDHLR